MYTGHKQKINMSEGDALACRSHPTCLLYVSYYKIHMKQHEFYIIALYNTFPI